MSPSGPSLSVPAFAPVLPPNRWWRTRRWFRRGSPPLAAAAVLAISFLVPTSEHPAPDHGATAAAEAGAEGSTGGSAAAASGADPGAPDGGAESEGHEGAEDDVEALVAAPVRIADAATVRLLSPGDHVDVLAAPARQSSGSGAGDRADVAQGISEGDDESASPEDGLQAERIAHRAEVIEIPAPSAAEEIDPSTGALVVVEVPATVAAALAAATADSLMTVTRW